MWNGHKSKLQAMDNYNVLHNYCNRYADRIWKNTIFAHLLEVHFRIPKGCLKASPLELTVGKGEDLSRSGENIK